MYLYTINTFFQHEIWLILDITVAGIICYLLLLFSNLKTPAPVVPVSQLFLFYQRDLLNILFNVHTNYNFVIDGVNYLLIFVWHKYSWNMLIEIRRYWRKYVRNESYYLWLNNLREGFILMLAIKRPKLRFNVTYYNIQQR